MALTGPEYLQSPQKRNLDRAGSLVLGALLAPVALGVGAALAVNARSNPFFIQKRFGGIRGEIDTYKFRTMTVARNIGTLASEQVLDDAPLHTSRIANIIRKSGLDELPQLVNVLKGDMSLVGPRPMVQADLKQLQKVDSILFTEWMTAYGGAKAGITGESQIHRHRYGPKDQQVASMRMDLDYFENASFEGDLACIAQTPVGLLLANVGR